jgi:membrane-associated phospholipid phosphatase
MTRQHESSFYPPLKRRDVAVRLVGGGLVLALALALIGWAIVKLATPSALTRWEDSVNQWFYAARTPTLDNVSHIGSYLAETITCIVLLVVATLALRLWLGRWRESWTLFAALVGELLVFLVVTAVVNRPRPDVPHLDAAPPTSSFPSGHTAAAVAFYGCLAVIVLRQLRPRWFAVVIATLLCLVPLVVGISRLYRGMHHPTDVVFGALGGGLWLALVLSTLLPRPRQDVAQVVSPDAHEEPERRLVT